MSGNRGGETGAEEETGRTGDRATKRPSDRATERPSDRPRADPTDLDEALLDHLALDRDVLGEVDEHVEADVHHLVLLARDGLLAARVLLLLLVQLRRVARASANSSGMDDRW